MSEGAVADRYAQAIFELAVEQNQLRPVTEQLHKLAETYASSPALRALFGNPLVDAPKRESLLQDLGTRLGVTGLALNAVRVIVARRRHAALPAIARRLVRLADEKDGLVRATVISAEPLSESFCSSLERELQAATRRKIVLEQQQDKSLIGGVVTRIGDHVIDGSIKGRLIELERHLLET